MRCRAGSVWYSPNPVSMCKIMQIVRLPPGEHELDSAISPQGSRSWSENRRSVRGLNRFLLPSVRTFRAKKQWKIKCMQPLPSHASTHQACHTGRIEGVPITGGHSNQDPRWTAKTCFPLCRHNHFWFWLLCSPETVCNLSEATTVEPPRQEIGPVVIIE